MIESLRRISEYVEGMRKEAFLADQKTIDAVVRNLEIVGEAAARGKATRTPPSTTTTDAFQRNRDPKIFPPPAPPTQGGKEREK